MARRDTKLISLGFWILVALGLVVLFNFYPHAYGSLFVSALLLLTMATLLRQYWFGRLTFFVAGNNTVANYSLVVAGICLMAYLLWSVMTLLGGRTIKPPHLTVTLMIATYFIGLISLSIGLYFQRRGEAQR